MSKFALIRVSPLSFVIGMNAFLVLAYVGMIAIVMSYAALHVEFAQEVRNNEAAVAVLEASYLASLATITTTDYASAGYAKPIAKIYVAGKGETALNTR